MSRVAVVGSGVAGLTAAYLLRGAHDVVLYEAQDRLGGHAHTHDVPVPGDPALPHPATASAPTVPVDSGFIVHNDRTYPHLLRLFDELGVTRRPTEMSMSVRCAGCGLEYAGGRGPSGFLGARRSLTRPAYWRMLLEVTRFHRRAAAHLHGSPEDDDTPLRDWLAAEAFSDFTIGHFVVPLVSCVWSSGHGTALDYPARYLFEFLDHHGMLSVTNSPRWHVVEGGSREYVRRIEAVLPDVRRNHRVTAVRRGDRVTVEAGGEREEFDHVVLATHADEALALLQDPTPAEREVLGAFGYTHNETVLHQDDSLLPRTRSVRASWNYLSSSCAPSADRPVVTYWMNRLQGHTTAQQHLVSLNTSRAIDPASVLARMDYTHPQFTPASRVAQRRLPELQTAQTVYAGAYHGWGFHEDGCRSGVQAARLLGATW